MCTGCTDLQPAAPALQYMSESVLHSWCTQAQWMEEALGEVKAFLGPQLQRASLQARGRALGGFQVLSKTHVGLLRSEELVCYR